VIGEGRRGPGGRLAAVMVGLVMLATLLTRLPFLRGPEIDWDEGVYWLSMQSMQAGHGLFSAVYSSQPPAFLGVTEPIWALLGGGIAAARAIMLIWWVAGLGAGAFVAWRLAGGVAAVAAAAVLCVDPLAARESITLQPDGPATALALIALALGVVSVTARRQLQADAAAVLAGAALAFGELTKLFDVAALPALAGLLLFTRHDRSRLATAAVAGGLVAAAAFLVPLLGEWQQLWNQSVGMHLGSRTAVAYGNSLTSVLKDHSLAILATALVGAIIGWRRHPRLVITGVLWLAGSAATLAEIKPLWPHHAVVATPGLALLDAAAAATLLAWLTERGRESAAAALALAAASGAAAILVLDGLKPFPPSPVLNFPAIVSALERMTPASGLVLGDDQYDQALARRLPPPDYVDTSITRFRGQGVTTADLEAAVSRDPVCAVLFQSHKLSSLDGFQTWVAAHFTQRTEIGGNATLYVRPRCGGG
jgi:4-amino-4-deoxy-L-arabinose transferase-like glycosyltransferase